MGFFATFIAIISIGLGLYVSNIIPLSSFNLNTIMENGWKNTGKIGGLNKNNLLLSASQLHKKCGLVRHLNGDNPYKTVQSTSSLPLWGSYRPGIYFGMKQRSSPYFMNSGIMWADGRALSSKSFRHQTDPNELSRFEWVMHDGVSFGIHEIEDKDYGMNINASFIIEPTEDVIWTQKFDVNSIEKNSRGAEDYALFFYFGAECDTNNGTEQIACLSSIDSKDWSVDSSASSASSKELQIKGYSSLTGNFKLSIIVEANDDQESNSSNTPEIHYWAPHTLLTVSALRALQGDYRNMDGTSNARTNGLGGQRRLNKEAAGYNAWSLEDHTLSDVVEEGAAAIVVQVSWSGRSSMSILTSLSEFVADDQIAATALLKKDVNEALDSAIRQFNRRFDSVFGLTTFHGFSSDDREVGLRALSAMLGGIGHFTGRPIIGDAEYESSELDKTSTDGINSLSNGSERDLETIYGRSISLLTCTPSRTAFPRGFLWDEGFHQLLVSSWNPHITMKVISDWMKAMYFPSPDAIDDVKISDHCVGGWIPREMILGAEATARVPADFVTQRPNIANPPTLLLAVEKLLKLATNTEVDETIGGTCKSNDEETVTCSKNKYSVKDVKHDEILSFVRDLYPSLHTWVQWFLTSQAGPSNYPFSYRWRGRSSREDKLAPNTLASGLDDYPRSLHPSADEMHLDLLCWMATAARTMHSIEKLLNDAGTDIPEVKFDSHAPKINNHHGMSTSSNNGTSNYYKQLHEKLIDSLELYHWAEEYKVYADVGWQQEGNGKIMEEVMVRCAPASEHPTDDAGSGAVDISVPAGYVQQILAKAKESGETRPPDGLCPPEYPTFLGIHGNQYGGMRTKRVYRVPSPATTPLTHGHIPRIGYLSLYPLLLQLLPPDSPRLEAILDIIEDEKQLWSDHGLRSISESDPFYREANAPGDEPYWRGPIWININYLALQALHYYGDTVGPYQTRIKAVYSRLRSNLLKTVVGEYRRTGFFWEQYDERSGQGMRNHPFSGWTALILNVMGEVY